MPIRGIVTPHETAKVRQAIQFINEHYKEDISLDGLVEEVRLDRKIFRQIFKELTGTTVHSYHLTVRIRHAKDDLADWSFTVDQVARRNGFRSASRFTKTFRKLTGNAPTEFRLQLLNAEQITAHVFPQIDQQLP